MWHVISQLKISNYIEYIFYFFNFFLRFLVFKYEISSFLYPRQLSFPGNLYNRVPPFLVRLARGTSFNIACFTYSGFNKRNGIHKKIFNLNQSFFLKVLIFSKILIQKQRAVYLASNIIETFIRPTSHCEIIEIKLSMSSQFYLNTISTE